MSAIAAVDLQAIPLGFQVFIALVFIRAAVGKLRGLEVFEGVLANYRLLPRRLVRPVSVLLPLAECTLAATLLVPAAHPLGALLPAALLLVFAAAMAINLGRGRSEIDCGCGDANSRRRLSWALVTRNLLMAFGLGLAALYPALTPSLGDLSVAGGGGLIVFLLLLCQETMAAWPKAKGRPRARRRAMSPLGAGGGARL